MEEIFWPPQEVLPMVCRRRVYLWLGLLAILGSSSPQGSAVPVKSGKPGKKGPVRVLLVASGPGREYQCLKNLSFREDREKLMEVGVILQGSKKEDIDPDERPPQVWMLDRFPGLRGGSNPLQKPYALLEYDLVIACDPDWMALPLAARKLLEDWVKNGGGNLILIAGPVNTRQLSQKVNRAALAPIRRLYPVTPEADAPRGKFPKHVTPNVLHFCGANEKMRFLKLDEKGHIPLAGWEPFFYGLKGGARGKPRAVRGFYSVQPVKAVKGTATVIATLGEEKKGTPFLITMPLGVGTVVYAGSGELWRLRTYRADYYNRFWLELVRYLVPARK